MQNSFLLNNLSETQISEISHTWAVHLSGPYSKTRNAQGTNQNAPFHRRSVNSHEIASGLTQIIQTVNSFFDSNRRLN